MTPQTQTFPNVTPAQVAAMVDELRAQNATVTLATPSGDTYTIEAHGVIAAATYAGTSLIVTVTNKPFYVPIGTIWDGIRKALAS